MHTAIEIGQNWSIWVPSRRQWLLGTVIRREDGQATLKYDARYKLGAGYDESRVDESTMLTTPNLFRPIE
ncbi:MAG TPA: hypothetical protein VGI89_12025 [Rhizomicrobium sp.]|jgi:hypothetical protein